MISHQLSVVSQTFVSGGFARVGSAIAAGASDHPSTHATAGGPNITTMLFVFMLATFLGFEVIRRVSPLLHTPLMSLTNAISAIAIVGSIVITGQQHSTASVVLGFIAIIASATNVVSGFLITDRMLKMFKRREPRKP